jgi:hypothetical protein
MKKDISIDISILEKIEKNKDKSIDLSLLDKLDKLDKNNQKGGDTKTLYKKEWYKKNSKNVKNYNKDYYEKHKEKHKAKMLEAYYKKIQNNK